VHDKRGRKEKSLGFTFTFALTELRCAACEMLLTDEKWKWGGGQNPYVGLSAPLRVGGETENGDLEILRKRSSDTAFDRCC
jgi:hypothetical protein